MLNHFSHVWLSVTLWTVACQGPLSRGFSRQEYWSGLPWPPPGDLPDPGIKSTSVMSPALVGRFIYNELRYFLLPEYRIPNTSDSKFGTKAYKEFRDFTSSTHNPPKATHSNFRTQILKEFRDLTFQAQTLNTSDSNLRTQTTVFYSLTTWRNISKYLRHNIWNWGPQRVHRPHTQNTISKYLRIKFCDKILKIRNLKTQTQSPLKYLRFKFGSSKLNEFRDYTDWTQNPNVSDSNFKPQILKELWVLIPWTQILTPETQYTEHRRSKGWETWHLKHRPAHASVWNLRTQTSKALKMTLKMAGIILRQRPSRNQRPCTHPQRLWPCNTDPQLSSETSCPKNRFPNLSVKSQTFEGFRDITV